ncbi:hypothetical protein FSARC_10776 [Fusarium sarcochroum]|uniref:Transcription factor n=1 Tax=Fusarium sarcochroum TaxID=1208366 RepID=A0A8H4TJP2_9HYPO|nr:hypothetical protein FSARC_10776 [Fusarium sarcochroum]
MSADNEKLEVRAKSDRSSKSPTSPQHPTAQISLPTADKAKIIFNKEASFDPFERGILSLKAGETFLDYFKTRMTPYFPFVLFPKDISVTELNSQQPLACLAALAAASHPDVAAQKSLGSLFNQIVAAKLVDEKLSHMDLLRGLLIHLAWAHYQPRPKRPRRPKLWSVEGGKDRNEPDWNPDEMRALAGAYYLSSSSSIMLQKTRQCFDTSYISACCDHLASMNECPTDKYLPYMIQVQGFIERVEDLVCKASLNDNGLQLSVESQEITQRCNDIKSALPFPLSESPPLLIQVHVLELLLSQSTPRGTVFGLDKFQNHFEDQASLMDWLSASMSAARSLISVTLVMPHGEEMAMSNMGWIMIHCGLNLAVRLDLIAARGSISGSTQHLRRFLDMPHTLRQLVLRFEATPGPDAPADHPFNRLAERIRHLEEWYLAQADRQAVESSASISPAISDQPSITISNDGSVMPVGGSMPYQSAGNWAGGSEWYQSTELDMSTFLFADPIEFPSNFGFRH